MEKKKILVIEDEQDTASYLTTLFEDNGYDALAAKDGQEGMQIAKQESPDLITLDISMPESPGARFFKELRSDSDLGSVPVVVVTAVTGYAGDPYGYLKFMQKQANIPEPEAFFPKPIEQDAFLETVRKLLSN